MAISINNNTGNIFAGGDETDGDLVLQGTEGQNRIHLDAGGANGWFGGNGEEGNILLFASGGDNATTSQATIHLNGGGGALRLGGNGTSGDLVLTGPGSSARISLDAGFGNVSVGGNNTDGDLLLFNGNGDNTTVESATIHLDGGGGGLRLGGNGTNGDLVLRNNIGQDRIRLDADGANGWFGGNGEEGNIVLFASGGDNATTSQATIHLNGGTGDIVLQNADCAEDFEVETLETAEPGTVMVIGNNSRLRVSDQAYDQRVAGIVAGASKYRPGIILGRKKGDSNCLPIALMGRVYCKVDAQYGAIEVGDLLTTSPTLGHAMKAGDPLKAFGAIIGKALQGHKQGKGLVPILVCLQ